MAGRDRNQYLTVALNNARSSLRQFRDARMALTTKRHGLGSIATLDKFLRDWSKTGSYDQAVANLPKDNPNTPINEGISVDDINKESQYFIHKNITDVTLKDVEEIYLKTMAQEIRKIIGQQYQLDTEIDAAKSKVDDLVALQKNEAEELKNI